MIVNSHFQDFKRCSNRFGFCFTQDIPLSHKKGHQTGHDPESQVTSLNFTLFGSTLLPAAWLAPGLMDKVMEFFRIHHQT